LPGLVFDSGASVVGTDGRLTVSVWKSLSIALDNVGNVIAEIRRRYHDVVGRLRRIERRELREFRDWIENTRNLVHLSILLFVPLLIGFVTYLSNAIEVISFLLFPPLASGTYTLFADPEGRYASPTTFVGGMTAGGLCGWIALEVSATYLYHVPPEQFHAHVGAAALGIFLTGVVTWAFDLEVPSAFSTALLVLLVNADELVFVAGIAVSSSIVAGAFAIWRSHFYERRARFLYQSARGDDHVLVPMRTETAERTALFAGRVAAAHEAGKVVLLDVVVDEDIADVERSMLLEDAAERLTALGDGKWMAETELDATESPAIEEPLPAEETDAAVESAMRLERTARRVETKIGVPTEVVVAVGEGDSVGTVYQAAEATNCDLIVAPYEQERDRLSAFLRNLFRGDRDVVVFRSADGEGDAAPRWRRAMVAVRRATEASHAMIDFAQRVTGRSGSVSVCTCIDAETQRRRAESMLADLVEAFEGAFETRVARTTIESFLSANAPQYDLVIVGASTDRTAASRFLLPPTFERISDVDTDVAIVHRA
jgi:nucleotide-binding universal stress UspA family protein